MALNNYMHPRNVYKTPPDFAKLAKIYPEFSSVTIMVRTNFYIKYSTVDNIKT